MRGGTAVPAAGHLCPPSARSEGGCHSVTVFQRQRWKPLLGHGSCTVRHAAWPQAPHCHSFHSRTCVSFSFHELLLILFSEEIQPPNLLSPVSSSSPKTMDLDPASCSSQQGPLQHLCWCTQSITAAHTRCAGRKVPDLFACVVIWLQELLPKCPLIVRNSWNNKINSDLLNLCWTAQCCCQSCWWWRNGGCWKWSWPCQHWAIALQSTEPLQNPSAVSGPESNSTDVNGSFRFEWTLTQSL